MKPGELETAQHALHGLKFVLSAAEQSSVGADAKKMMERLDLHLRTATSAVELIAASADSNSRARSLVAEHNQVKPKALMILSELRNKASYTGSRRSQMSVEERVAYVRQNGERKFSMLPE